MDKTDRLRDYGLAFLLYEQGLGICGYELIRELFIFIKLILNSYLIKKILVFFICSIVPYISKGQCLDSLKSVCLPDSIAEQIENSYEDKYTNASKNVVNLISPNNYNFVDGIYAFKGMGPHFPRQIFVYKREKIFIFNSRGDYNPEGVIMEFCSCIKKLNLTHKEIVDYLNVICLYLQEEEVTDYGDTIK